MTTVDDFKHQLPDIDEDETQDWVDSFDQVLDQEGENRARFLVYKLLKRARQLQIGLPPLTQTRYINTISPEQEPAFPGDEAMELRIRRIVRWNAVAMVLRANNRYPGIGGHLSRMPARRASTRSASTTSSVARTTPGVATRCSTRGTHRRACTPARSSRGGCPRTSSTISAGRASPARA